MADFGSDISTFVGDPPGLDPDFGLITGTRAVAEVVARRITSPRGSIPGSPDDGIDVREALNEPFSTALAARLKAAIATEALRDERVLSARSDVSFNAAAQSLRVSVDGTTADGPFALVLDASQLSVAILEAS